MTFKLLASIVLLSPCMAVQTVRAGIQEDAVITVYHENVTGSFPGAENLSPYASKSTDCGRKGKKAGSDCDLGWCLAEEDTGALGCHQVQAGKKGCRTSRGSLISTPADHDDLCEGDSPCVGNQCLAVHGQKCELNERCAPRRVGDSEICHTSDVGECKPHVNDWDWEEDEDEDEPCNTCQTEAGGYCENSDDCVSKWCSPKTRRCLKINDAKCEHDDECISEYCHPSGTCQYKFVGMPCEANYECKGYSCGPMRQWTVNLKCTRSNYAEKVCQHIRHKDRSGPIGNDRANFKYEAFIHNPCIEFETKNDKKVVPQIEFNTNGRPPEGFCHMSQGGCPCEWCAHGCENTANNQGFKCVEEKKMIKY